MPVDSNTRSDSVGHTDGPWVLRPNGCDEQALIAPNSGRMVAYAAWTGGSGCELRIENDADARLIVLTPELFRQLQYAVKLLSAFPALSGTAQVQSMRDTLAKATPPALEERRG